MKFYYQYDAVGWVVAIVKSAGEPLDVNQIVLDAPLGHGRKKFDTVTKEVVYYKSTYRKTEVDTDGNPLVTGIEEDTSKPRVKIDQKNLRTV